MASRKPHARLPSPLGVRARDSRRVSHLQHGRRGLPELSLALATRTIKWLAAAILSMSLIRSRRTHCSICAQGPAPPWRSSDVELHSVPARHRELPTKLGPIFVVSSPCLLRALYRDAAALSSQGRAPRPRRAPAPGREHHLVAPRRCSRVAAGSSATIGDRAPSSSSSATSSSTTSAPRSSATTPSTRCACPCSTTTPTAVTATPTPTPVCATPRRRPRPRPKPRARGRPDAKFAKRQALPASSSSTTSCCPRHQAPPLRPRRQAAPLPVPLADAVHVHVLALPRSPPHRAVPEPRHRDQYLDTPRQACPCRR